MRVRSRARRSSPVSQGVPCRACRAVCCVRGAHAPAIEAALQPPSPFPCSTPCRPCVPLHNANRYNAVQAAHLHVVADGLDEQVLPLACRQRGRCRDKPGVGGIWGAQSKAGQGPVSGMQARISLQCKLVVVGGVVGAAARTWGTHAAATIQLQYHRLTMEARTQVVAPLLCRVCGVEDGHLGAICSRGGGGGGVGGGWGEGGGGRAAWHATQRGLQALSAVAPSPCRPAHRRSLWVR